MNRVILSGGVSRDPEVRYTQSGKAYATFSIGVNRGYKKAENSQYPPSDFFNVVAWDKTAEFCGKYLAKGTRILVEGRLQTRNYEAQDGSKRYVTEVVADSIEFAGAKRQGGEYGNDYQNDNYNSSRVSEPPFGGSNNANDDMIDNSGSMGKDDIDIPF